MKIAVISGGRSSEHDASKASFENVLGSLDERVTVAVSIYVDRDGRFHLDEDPQVRQESELLQLPILTAPEVAALLGRFWTLNLLHGQEGEDGVFAGWARVNGLPGSWGSTVGDAINMAKWASGPIVSSIMGARGRTPDTFTFRPGDHLESVPLNRPLIIKPGSSGASIKTSAADVWSVDCEDLIADIFKTVPTALVQERIFGDEYSVGVLELDGKVVSLPVVAINSPDGFYDHTAKHSAGHATKAFHENALTKLLQELAIDIFAGTESFGMARVDFIVPPDDVPVYLETNTLPGLMAGSIFPAMLRQIGMTITDLVVALHAADSARRGRELDVKFAYTIEEAH